MSLTTHAPGMIGRMVNLFSQYGSLYLQGLYYTLLLAVIGTLTGLIISFVLVVLKTQKIRKKDHVLSRLIVRTSKGFAQTYVMLFRATPMMVQAMIFYYGLASMGFRLPIFTAGLIVVSLNTAAYLTEILRSGLESLDQGQEEAALSLGLSTQQTYRHILFPQAFKNMIPAIGNELIVNIKDTAVLSVIGVGELFYAGRSVAGATYQTFEAFLIVAIMYLIVVMIAVWGLKKLTQYMGKNPTDVLKSESEGTL